jgi:hypothetical protein
VGALESFVLTGFAVTRNREKKRQKLAIDLGRW